MAGGLLAVFAASPAAARALYVCSQPDGHISITTFVGKADERAGAIARMIAAGIIPGGHECWDMEDTALPPQSRPDPRHPGDHLSQEHRWRRGIGDSVSVDVSVRRPHGEAIARELDRLLPLVRMAQVMSTPLGDNFLRTLRRQNWPLVQALVRQMRLQVGTPGEVLTLAELDEIGRIGDDYEADLR